MSKDACYNKVKSRYKVFPSAYASGALAKCRKVGASNWGNSSKKATGGIIKFDNGGSVPKRTEMEKEYGLLPKSLRDKNTKGMLSKSLQKTRTLEALARGEKVSGIDSKLSAKQFQSIKKVQRGKDYKGRGDVPTEKQVKERAKTYKNGGFIANGCGAVTQNRRKTTRIF
tara:strand:+ start:1254 stop:1763 length:510 start_codon:yes stop_codon:yes gene_type:complete